jgi:DNA topoisomerase-2
MDGIQFEELVPWYKGFTGEIKANEKNNFDAKGVF